MEAFDFRRRQDLSDLHRVPGASVVEDPSSTVFAPDASPDLVRAALARAIAEALEAGTDEPFLADMWQTALPSARKAPAPVRAALMNGIRTLHSLGLGEEIDPPTPADLVTLPLQRVASALIRIGRQMTADEMDHVARADYGCDVARHRKALEALQAEPRLAYPEGEYWYPAEVVELVSHVPGKPGHVPCLAIVLLAALRNDDAQGDAEFRLAQQSGAIAALDPEVRVPFFAAFRRLYETVPQWSPSLQPPFTLPWVSLPDA